MSDGLQAAARPSVPGRRAHHRAQRAAVTAVFLSHGFLFASWTAHIPHVRQALGLSYASLGLVLLATPVGSVCSMALTGRILPTLGSRRLVGVCLMGYCAAGPLVGLAASPLVLAAALFTWGAFQGSLDVAMNTQAVAVQRDQGRHLMPSFHGAWSIGAFAGAGAGALGVALQVSLSAQLLVLALPVLVAAVLLAPSLIGREAERSAHIGPGPAAHRRSSFSRATLTLGAIALASMLCEGATADWSAVYLRGPVHVDPGTAGLGYAAFAAVMAGVRLAGGGLLARIPARHLLPGLALVATAAMATGLAANTELAALIGFAALGAGVALVIPVVFSAAGDLAGLAPGVGIAIVSAFGWAGFVCGPPLIGFLASLAGLHVALAVIPVLTLIMALATARVSALRSSP